jgi:hypothetical protein
MTPALLAEYVAALPKNACHIELRVGDVHLRLNLVSEASTVSPASADPDPTALNMLAPPEVVELFPQLEGRKL